MLREFLTHLGSINIHPHDSTATLFFPISVGVTKLEPFITMPYGKNIKPQAAFVYTSVVTPPPKNSNAFATALSQAAPRAP